MPEHGASTRIRSNGPSSAGAVRVLRDHERGDAEPSRRVDDEARAAGVEIGGHHRRRSGPTRHATCAALPPGRRAGVEHALARLRVERRDDERRRLVLHREPALARTRAAAPDRRPRAAGSRDRASARRGSMPASRSACSNSLDRSSRTCSPGGTAAPARERLGGRLRLVARGAGAGARAPPTATDPVRTATSSSSARRAAAGGSSASRRRTAFTNPRSRSPASSTGLAHRRVRRDAHEQQLIRAEPKHGASARRSCARPDGSRPGRSPSRSRAGAGACRTRARSRTRGRARRGASVAARRAPRSSSRRPRR